MPVYKVEPEKNYPCDVVAGAPSGKGKKRYPTVCIPVSPEIIAALEVGKPVKVELTGTVQGLESRSSTESDPWSNRNELRMELRLVDANLGEAEEEDGPEETMEGAISKGLGYAKGKE